MLEKREERKREWIGRKSRGTQATTRGKSRMGEMIGSVTS